MPMDPPPDLASLSLTEVAHLLAEKRLPPVEKWNPDHCGDSEMRIGRDGSYVLVTPVEKLSIEVEDAPFLAVELKSEGVGRERALAFRLNSGDLVPAGPDHPLSIRETPDGPHPYVHVRGGLDALVNRSVYYELMNLALDEGGDPIGLWSNGAFFALDGSV